MPSADPPLEVNIRVSDFIFMSYLSNLHREGLLDKKVYSNLESKMLVAPDEVEGELVEQGISAAQILAAKSAYYDMPVKQLALGGVAFEVLKHIPEDSAKYYKVAPLTLIDGVLEVGILDPDNMEARDVLNFLSSKSGVPYKLFLISKEDFEKVMNIYKGLTGEVHHALEEFEGEISLRDAVKSDEEGEKPREVEVSGETTIDRGDHITEEAPVTKIVATVLRYATEGRASDVHIEPTADKLRVRFRVDGELHTSLMLPMKVHSAVVARVKVLSNIRLDEKRKPQDGRFSARIGGRKIDLRVSTFPSSRGEKVVMRILDPERGIRSLEEIGMSQDNLKLVREAARRPYGMILISGPTGSGKSTTLYAMVKELDLEKDNVLSLEDPVEYNIEGMAQSQVMPEIGYTFASGLRSILRQDPDIIMVGEIRDKETAQLAVQAALTGHLVLSTIHTNTAIGAIPRLIDMGVDPFLIGPTLNLVIAQRLARTLCPGAGSPKPLTGSLKAMVDKQFEDLPEEFRTKIKYPKDIYDATPGPDCPTGTRGRTAVMETLAITSAIEEAILRNASEQEIYAIARKGGMLTMKEDAILKAFDRRIPFEEVNAL
jgi:type IV pilus assembly protein PilB